MEFFSQFTCDDFNFSINAEDLTELWQFVQSGKKAPTHWKCVYAMPRRVNDAIYAVLKRLSDDNETLSKQTMLKVLQMMNPLKTSRDILRLYRNRFCKLHVPLDIQEVLVVWEKEWRLHRRSVVKEVENIGFFWMNLDDIPVISYEEEFNPMIFDPGLLKRFDHAGFAKEFSQYKFPEVMDRHLTEDLMFLLEYIRLDRVVFNDLLDYATVSWHFQGILKLLTLARRHCKGYETFVNFMKDEKLQQTLICGYSRNVRNRLDIILLLHHVIKSGRLVISKDMLVHNIMYSDPAPEVVRELLEKRDSNIGKMHILMMSPLEMVFVRPLLEMSDHDGLTLEPCLEESQEMSDWILEFKKRNKYHRNACLSPCCDREDVKMKRCMGCDAAVYCSSECQRTDWKKHKKFCRRLQSLRESKV